MQSSSRIPYPDLVVLFQLRCLLSAEMLSISRLRMASCEANNTPKETEVTFGHFETTTTGASTSSPKHLSARTSQGVSIYSAIAVGGCPLIHHPLGVLGQICNPFDMVYWPNKHA